MKKISLFLSLVCCAALVLGGCATSSQLKTVKAPVEQTACIPVQTPTLPLKDASAATTTAAQAPSVPVIAAAQEQKPGSDRFHPLSSVYFAFDSPTLDAAALKELDRFFTTTKPEGARFTIEGYCDERGDDDYNMALGERRSQAVRAYLKSRGLGTELSSVSYGREYPADPGHTEAAWKLNRRVEIVAAGAPKAGSRQRYGSEQ